MSESINKLVAKAIKNYSERNYTDATVRITESSGGLFTGVTASGRTVRGIQGDGSGVSVGQDISAQRGSGQWLVRGGGIFRAG